MKKVTLSVSNFAEKTSMRQLGVEQMRRVSGGGSASLGVVLRPPNPLPGVFGVVVRPPVMGVSVNPSA